MLASTEINLHYNVFIVNHVMCIIIIIIRKFCVGSSVARFGSCIEINTQISIFLNGSV